MQNTWRNSFYEIGWPGRPMPAVKWLLVVNFVVFCLQVVFAPGLADIPAFQQCLELNRGAIRNLWVWQFVTYMFLHAGVWHLLLNLLMLYLFGNQVEDEIGTRRFLKLYFLGGICGALVWGPVFLERGLSLVGASGAVYAVTIAFAALFPNRPITVFLFFILPVTLLAKYWAVGAVAISVLFALTDTANVAHLAHLGGIAAGFLYIKALNRKWKLFPVRVRTGRTSRHSSSHRPLETMASPFDERDFMSQRIDPILDKIASKGIQSLTKEERRLLEQAKDRLP